MKKWKEPLLIALIGLLSILSIFDNLNLYNIPKLIVSVIGLICVILFFVKKDKIYLVIKIWIIAQIPYIMYVTKTVTTLNQIQTQLSNAPKLTITETVEQISISRIWDAAQIFSFHLDMTVKNINLGINLIPLIFFGLYKILKTKQNL